MKRAGSLFLGFFLCASGPAGAQTAERVATSATLYVEPTPQCANAETLRRTVEDVLERPVFLSSEEALRVEVRFHAVADGWEARIRLFEKSAMLGERSLRSEESNCGALTGPMGLVIGLMLDAHRPNLKLRAPPPPIPQPGALEEDDDAGWGMRSMFDLRGSYGALPGGALGLSLGAVVIPPFGLPVRASLTLWPTADSMENGVGAKFRLWHGGLDVCPGWGEDLRLSVCSGIHVGQLEAAGVGLLSTKEPRHVWVHAATGLDLGIRLAGPLGLHLSADLTAPLNRPNFIYTRAQSSQHVHRPGVLVPMMAIGIESTMPP